MYIFIIFHHILLEVHPDSRSRGADRRLAELTQADFNLGNRPTNI